MKIAFWGRRVWRVESSHRKGAAGQHLSDPKREEKGFGGHFSMESLARRETLGSQEERLQGDVC